MSFWNTRSDFRLNHSTARPLLTHEKAFYLDTIHPVTQDYITPTRLFPVVRHKARTTAEMRQEILDAWEEVRVKSAEKEREQRLLVMKEEAKTRKDTAQRRREEAERQRQIAQRNAKQIRCGRVFSEISRDLRDYTLEQISADPELQDRLLSILPGLLAQNAQRIASLKEMLGDK
ncbi:hypothetical protein GL50803_0016162 [Giardia duodenalis]|uniref:Uncharacterized protein n=1 Tax=Giardia intestinalis (strain ATCC 50803 / WB clone C6) TaxID=184922 RepID=A8BN36_GIAIC|nr:hypothetical protein GL50803_0016162 [Giardia intestinalis]KAE8305553.1 hypothetical protein GL50803_0016162 [Giardia intestinalis]|eukprot:XP_001706018.1 Hypothetical protein GL50803_16162 [Giardia lamblia ATCC 50803]